MSDLLGYIKLAQVFFHNFRSELSSFLAKKQKEFEGKISKKKEKDKEAADRRNLAKSLKITLKRKG